MNRPTEKAVRREDGAEAGGFGGQLIVRPKLRKRKGIGAIAREHPA